MNSIESITQKITQDANDSAKEKLQEAEEEAKEILKTFAAQASKASDETLRIAQKEASALADRVASQAELAKRNLLLQYKREGISQAFEQALSGMCALPEERQLAFLSAAAVKYQTENAQLILNAKDRAAFGEKLVALVNLALKAAHKNYSASLSEKIGSFSGGMVLVEGSIETNCSYEILIKNIRDELEGEVAQVLYA